jgi:hypothetical protein
MARADQWATGTGFFVGALYAVGRWWLGWPLLELTIWAVGITVVFSMGWFFEHLRGAIAEDRDAIVRAIEESNR